MRLIPAIDLKHGRCVRLYQGDFARETRYAAAPRELLERYRSLGADWLHVVDLDAARGAREGEHNRGVIAELAAAGGVNLQIGGGLRSAEAVSRALDLGAARAVIGSAALTDADAVRDWLGRFGAERIALALDVRLDPQGTPRIATHGWLEQSTVSLWEAVDGFRAAGLRHVLCTDVSRDGALSGPNVELYIEAVQRFPDIVWQASGGVRSAGDLAALAASGAGAAVSGKALLENLIPIEELKPFLPNA
jgi:phosphoribosylformimino-5-aminoimidazole carboxamide ribotide isomerase